jgi:hypothetical protein
MAIRSSRACPATFATSFDHLVSKELHGCRYDEPEAQLRGVTAPVCLIAGNDVVHTPVTARKAAGLFPNNEFHDDVVRKLPDDKLLHDWDQDEWRSVEPRLVEIFGAFLKRKMRAAAA